MVTATPEPTPLDPEAPMTVMPAVPTVDATVDGYTVKWPGVEAVVSRLEEHSGDLTCELAVISTRPMSEGGLLSPARFNLMAPRTRSDIAKKLAQRDPDLDWEVMLEQLVEAVLERHRRGEPEVDLREYVPTIRSRWLLEPFLETGGPTILFADGGTGKSFFALAIAVSVASGVSIVGHLRGESCPVLYLDWETDASTAQERVQAIRWAAGIVTPPPMFYRRQFASLIESASEVRRIISRQNIGLVVVDSLGAARGGEPESADITIRTFNAARSLGVPWLGVDHVTKAQGNDSTKPFGSAFAANLARLTWSMDKADEDKGSQKIALVNRKQNNVGKIPSQGYRMRFDRDEDDSLNSLAFERFDVPGDADLGHRASLRDRIKASLAVQFLTARDLATELGAPLHSVEVKLSEMRKKGEALSRDDHKWGIAPRRN